MALALPSTRFWSRRLLNRSGSVTVAERAVGPAARRVAGTRGSFRSVLYKGECLMKVKRIVPTLVVVLVLVSSLASTASAVSTRNVVLPAVSCQSNPGTPLPGINGKGAPITGVDPGHSSRSQAINVDCP